MHTKCVFLLYPVSSYYLITTLNWQARNHWSVLMQTTMHRKSYYVQFSDAEVTRIALGNLSSVAADIRVIAPEKLLSCWHGYNNFSNNTIIYYIIIFFYHLPQTSFLQCIYSLMILLNSSLFQSILTSEHVYGERYSICMYFGKVFLYLFFYFCR